MIFFGEESFRHSVNTYLIHYHRERNHKRLGNKLIDPTEEVSQTEGKIECREGLGGLLKHCYLKAA